MSEKAGLGVAFGRVFPFSTLLTIKEECHLGFSRLQSVIKYWYTEQSLCHCISVNHTVTSSRVY